MSVTKIKISTINRKLTNNVKTTAIMPKPNLDTKEKQIVAGLLQGKTQKQIAESIGYTPETVCRKISNNINIIEALNNAGINTDYLANKAKELLEAKRPLYNPKTQEFQDVPDNNARNTAFSTTCKLAGHLRDNVENTQNIQVNIVQYGDKNVEVEGNISNE